MKCARSWICWAVAVVWLFLGVSAPAAEDFFLRDGQRVIFLGDSITQAGTYVHLIETFVHTRYPDRVVEIINHGISSETISGTSEIDHNPRRPDAQNRFARDVAAWKPDVLVACFGMNDGNYHPFDQPRFAAYQAGVRRLIQRTRDEAGASLVLLTPPPFDAYRRKAGDPEAKYFGYKYPALDYDTTLSRYSDWLLTLQREQIPVVDLHSAINRHVTERRRTVVSFHVSPDAIHPNITGHWLMAQQVLSAWNAASEVANVRLDSLKLEVISGDVDRFSRSASGLRFRWKSRLPMPFDAAIDRESLAVDRSFDRFNQYRLVVTGLDQNQYRIYVGETVLGDVSAAALEKGIDLNSFPALPTHAQAVKVWQLVRDRQKTVYADWRKQIASDEPAPDVARRPKLEDDPSWKAIRDASQPMVMEIRLQPR